MEERHIDAVLVPTSDYHESEYVGEHFACRKYITGFTGSAGTALITRDWAGVWTDGRYFVQAAAELKDTGVELMKMGQPGVLSLEEYLEQLPDGITPVSYTHLSRNYRAEGKGAGNAGTLRCLPRCV